MLDMDSQVALILLDDGKVFPIQDPERRAKLITAMKADTARACVPCPRCGSKRDKPCISMMTGDTGTHQERRDRRLRLIELLENWDVIVEFMESQR